MKLWSIAQLDKSEATEIQSKYGLPPLLAMMLQIRGIKTQDEIDNFLFNDSKIASPFEIKDMDRAAERINRAVDKNELICVYGDFDVDGITSTAILYSYLQTISANAMFYIPSRENEGYGMNKDAVDFLNEKGVRLIVTVDNGIAAANEVAYANSLGIDTVVTDHHMPQKDFPQAYAVVDPHREDCPSKFKNLCGAGVAFKLIMALEGEDCDFDSLYENYSDLLCIATIADIVELSGENRAFVKHGLESLKICDRIGINKLMEKSDIDKSQLSVYDVSFKIAPRLNSVGRLGNCEAAVKLLLTDDEEEADEISELMCDDNSKRRQIEADELTEIENTIMQNPSFVNSRIIVIDGENWRQGVNGLVASKLKEAFGKPVIVISHDGDEAKGSARSVEGFPIHTAVAYCSDLLMHHGGHPMAAGLSLKTQNIDLFRKKINEFANSFENMPFDSLNISCKLNPAFINVDMINSLDYLKPYGAGNPTPLFGFYNMTVADIIPLANDKHLKLMLNRNGTTIEAMQFGMSTSTFPYNKGDVVDIAAKLDINEYNGYVKPSVIVQAIKFLSDDTVKILKSQRIFEDFCCGVKITKEEIFEILPNRNDFVLLYTYLRKNNGYNYPFVTLMHRLDNKLTYGKIRVILEALNELGLIKINEGVKESEIRVIPNPQKVNLESAEIIRKLKEMSL